MGFCGILISAGATAMLQSSYDTAVANGTANGIKTTTDSAGTITATTPTNFSSVAGGYIGMSD